MDSCDVNLLDVYRYLGIKGKEVDEVTKNQVDEMVDLLKTNTSYKETYQIFPIKLGEPIEVIGTTLTLDSKSIKQLLAESTDCVIMAVTLGQQVDKWIREWQIRDMSRAVILDACASSFIEECCNKLEEQVKEKIGSKFLTDRFSPGYGDLPLSMQPLLCKVLQTDKKLGLTVSKTHIMSPKKSITAILGIADTPQPMRIKGCAYCNLRQNCQYRKGGRTCGS